MNFYNLIAQQQANHNKEVFNDKGIEYPSSEGKLNMDINTKFPKISLNKRLHESASDLNKIIVSTYKSDGIHIPFEICCEIVLYSLTLIPGIYNFLGIMSDGWSEENGCSCRIVLDDNSSIIGGCFQEIYYSGRSQEPQSSFEYEITNGTYNYINGGIEFYKHYFPFNYQYKIWGQIVYKLVSKEEDNNDTDQTENKMDVDNVEDIDDTEIQIRFKGKWQRLTTRRSGLLDMKLTNKTVTLEHAIRPGKYVFFGLSSCKQGNGDENDYKLDVNMKIEVEFCKHGVVDGMIYLFLNDWTDNYEEDDIDDGKVLCPDNQFSYDSFKIVDGEWHHFGKIIFVFENNKQMNGFFNGSFYIGEWHKYDANNDSKYITKRFENGDMFHKSSSVLSMFSDNGKQENDDTEMSVDKYEERAKDRIGHFEFTLIENDKKKNRKSRLVQTARGGVVSVMAANVDENEDEDEEEVMIDNNNGILHRAVSLDSDEEEVEDIE